MSTNQNINFSFKSILQDLFLLQRSDKTIEHFNSYRIIFKAFFECFVVLQRQNGCRTQVGNLFTFNHDFKGSGYCNFCFAKANISAKQSVHWFWAFQICFDFLNGCFLIFCQLIFKFIFEFNLIWCVWLIGVSNIIIS